MTKEIFLHQLRIRLTRLPEAEIQKRLDYYSEIIDDMLEDGISEEDAIASFGPVDDVAQRILKEMPLTTLVKQTATPKRGWTAPAIILAVVGSPLWIPVGLALLIVALSVFVVIWALIVSAFAVVISLGFAGICLLIRAFGLLATAGFGVTIFTVGAALVLVGLCLLSFLGAKQAALWLIQLSKWIFAQIKSLFIGKEDRQ